MGKMKELETSMYDVPDDVMLNDVRVWLWETIQWLEGKSEEPNQHVSVALSRWYDNYNERNAP